MDSATRIARKMATLAGMGFQRVDSPLIPPETMLVKGGRHKVICSQPSMGTLVSVTAVHESPGLIQDAAALAFGEMDRVVNLLNRYDPASALSYLNTEGSIEGPPPELSAVMQQARFFHDASEGAFDPTVQPLVDLFRNRLGGGDPNSPSAPSEAEILQALAIVDARKVELTPQTIRLSIPGMGVTLDGIAKGYVVDRMAAVLAGQGLEDFLINAGGDIRSAGFREDGREWRVGVQDPAKQGDLPDVIGLTNGAVATSGSYEIYFDRERTHHHIVSARSGESPQSSQSVSVVAPTTLAADALATSVFVMEPERGVAFIESLPQCACLIVDHQGRQLRSQRWRSATDLPHPRQG
ncbi:MAG: FAD:protein FMN transferase [Longimicrobiales bacterium]|nr:FAD:protein FMN transferase [Longimicrobiales bacterium]